TAEPAPATLWIPLKPRASRLLSLQHGSNARQKLPKAERLGDIVIGAEFQPDHPVDLVAPIAGSDNHRNIGARPDLAQQVEPILLVKPQIENDEIKLAFGQMTQQLLMSGCREAAHVVVFEIVDDHASHDVVIFDDQNAC